MTESKAIRIGLMGFGQVGRQIYRLACASEDLEIAAIADIGKPDILSYLLHSDCQHPLQCKLAGNHLVSDRFRSRMLQHSSPGETPWDVFGVDIVIDATREYRHAASLQAHLDAGAPRVLVSTLPTAPLDRLLLPGINTETARSADRIVSAGSPTTTALALCLKILDEALGVDTASMTTVHAYSSDQPAQDRAGEDFRRSRSAATNIIPNTNASPHWVESLLPQFAGKLSGYALNVPVQHGSLLDLNTVMRSADASVEDVNRAFIEAQDRYPELLCVADDPIVSSDVIGSSYSVVFDRKGTLKAGRRMIKSLAWYEDLSHAYRLIETVRIYQSLASTETAA
jgi:glyceraldehyde 3-phosphate dehydrogenase